MYAVHIPVPVAPNKVKWDDIELFRRRFGVLWSNLKDLRLGQFGGAFTKQPDGRYTGGLELPNEYRLKGLYVDFRHFYLNDEPTNMDRFSNYLASLTTSMVFRRFLRTERKPSGSDFLESGWFEHNGKCLATERFLDVWFNAEIFHSNRGQRSRTWKTKALLEWMEIFSDQTARSMLFMAVYDRILTVRKINWVAMEFSPSNMNLRMPNSAMQLSPAGGRGRSQSLISKGENPVNPILRKAVETLSHVVNVSTGLTHPLDESRAKELFKSLHKEGIPLNANDVYSVAVENCWPERHAKKLSELAEKIGNGGRVQIKHPRDWGEPTVKKIIAELN